MRILILCVYFVFGLGANVDNVKFQTDNTIVNVFLYLDSMPTISPKQNKSKDVLALSLKDVSIKKKINKKILNNQVKSIEIFSKNNKLNILAIGEVEDLKASIAKQENVLKISFSPKDPSLTEQLINKNTKLSTTSQLQDAISEIKSNIENSSKNIAIATNSEQNNTEQKMLIGKPKEELLSWRYITLVILMLGLIVLLSIIKRKQRKKYGFSLLSDTNAKIVSQTKIDSKNKLVIVQAKEYEYLIVVGETGHLVIDRYPVNSNKPDDFYQKLKKNLENKNGTHKKQ